MMLGCTRCTLGVQAVTGVAYMTRICQKWGWGQDFDPPPSLSPDGPAHRPRRVGRQV